MTRQPHDQFAKQYLTELLASLGTVEISKEVPGEVRQIDLYFAPSATPTAEPQTLGLLGRLASFPCLLEPFRNQPSQTEIRSCLLKLLQLQSEFQRQARRENRTLSETELPRLWILATSASSNLIETFGAKLELENWCRGVYFLAEALKTAVVAINQLPTVPETLWLRILGKGTTQQQAISELIALPKANLLRVNTLELIANWRINLQMRENLTDEDRELIMNLSPAYLQWREATLNEGIQQGVQQGIQQGVQQGIQQGVQQGIQQGSLQGQRLVIENLLQVRFGFRDESILQIVDALLALPPQEYTRLILQLSREDLLARFSGDRD
ncbi:hypothetical protein [Oscillatoria salina]|uniref:hypothetical protein n=1 Tax=Oscillatoria salina TaxID=331517 RepID=UPI001CC934DA|nr:hypothetical protein [Oscillatoria salina]MBZ8179994.1 hypothetical protein [Oscillatoria salina IIICB1]